jgi:hypothetical protein
MWMQQHRTTEEQSPEDEQPPSSFAAYIAPRKPFSLAVRSSSSSVSSENIGFLLDPVDMHEP